MEKQLFTTGNVRKFFTTSTKGLPKGQASLVNQLGKNYGTSAVAITKSASPELASPIISDMIGSYAKNVSLIVHGWAGNA